ncbi:hypothetical protein jhhlp_000447 [Lomentospora prolificans]|uniref:Large ribosomal subunit protein bL28m n=1 Tax=Lomentospora prolificans TaxID=41688 RepID=A0A2N3NKX7_9PEZI|nr:hypothetical protein jhhlp_000447 [Lomentospora prolificans]
MAHQHPIRALTTRLSTTLPQTPNPRAFSTTTPTLTKTIKASKIPAPLAPLYPPGERTLYKQSNQGLYGFSRIRFGNNVSGRNDTRTPRTWKPNVQRKKLWSESLGAWVKTRLTTRVLRTIKKEGGLDQYLTGHGRRRIEELGPAGWRLRWLVMQTPAMRSKMDAEREKLGLEPAKDGEAEAERREDLVWVAMDYATPGPLGRKTRDILERRTAEVLEKEHAFGEGERDDVEFQVKWVDGNVPEGFEAEAAEKAPETKTV